MTGVCIKSYPHFKKGDFGRKVTFQPSYPQCPQKLTGKSNTKTIVFKRLFLCQTDEKRQNNKKNEIDYWFLWQSMSVDNFGDNVQKGSDIGKV